MIDDGYRELYGKKIDNRTIDDVLNGLQGGKPSRPRNYQLDPVYETVDQQLFKYLEEMEV